jgi:hypothetical protein
LNDTSSTARINCKQSKLMRGDVVMFSIDDVLMIPLR